MNYTIDKTRVIQEGDLVEFTPFEDDYFSSRVPKGLYRLGPLDSYYGYKLFNIHDGREMPWCDSTRSNTVFAEIKPEKKGMYKIVEWLAKNWLRLGGVAITLILLFAAFSCSPTLSREDRKNERIEKRAKKRYFKLIKENPWLIDSTTKVDSNEFNKSVSFDAKNPLTQPELDSLLLMYCGDTVYVPTPAQAEKQKEIKRKIQERATHESLMGGKPEVFNFIEGSIIVSAKGNKLSVDNRIKTINTETTIYIPNEKCERQCEEDKDQLKKDHRYQLLKWCLICIAIGYVLNWVVRVILRSGGLR